MHKNQPVYCRYHLVSPFCMGKNRPLRPDEMTIEHLIPKTRMRQGSFRDKYGLKGIGTSSPENTDISCKRCNHYKKNATDLEFVWKLQYCARYGLDLQSKERLRESLLLRMDAELEDRSLLTYEEVNRVIHTILFGQSQISAEQAALTLGKNQVTLQHGRLVRYERGNITVFPKTIL